MQTGARLYLYLWVYHLELLPGGFVCKWSKSWSKAIRLWHPRKQRSYPRHRQCHLTLQNQQQQKRIKVKSDKSSRAIGLSSECAELRRATHCFNPGQRPQRVIIQFTHGWIASVHSWRQINARRAECRARLAFSADDICLPRGLIWWWVAGQKIPVHLLLVSRRLKENHPKIQMTRLSLLFVIYCLLPEKLVCVGKGEQVNWNSPLFKTDIYIPRYCLIQHTKPCRLS